MSLDPILRLSAVCAILSLLAYGRAGPLALDPIGASPRASMIGLTIFFAAATFLSMLLDSVRRAPNFVSGERGELDLRALGAALDKPGLSSFVIVLIAAYGISSTANLAEVYRASATRWNDPVLWNIESRLFTVLLSSSLNAPRFWDFIYQMLWLVVFLGLAGLARTGQLHRMAEALCAVVISFHMTRHLAIAFPTAGPVFLQPELFDLAGTASERLVELLRDYMAGEIPQNSILPGSQAMPSLHVGLAWCAMLVMARTWQWTLWLAVPWFVLNWMSTIFLGWHYALDGLGGVLVMSFSMFLASCLMRLGHCQSLTTSNKFP